MNYVIWSLLRFFALQTRHSHYYVQVGLAQEIIKHTYDVCSVYNKSAHICLSLCRFVCMWRWRHTELRPRPRRRQYEYEAHSMRWQKFNFTFLSFRVECNVTTQIRISPHTHTPKYTNTLSVNEKERKKYTSEILIIFNYRWLTVCVRNEWKRIFISGSKESTN